MPRFLALMGLGLLLVVLGVWNLRGDVSSVHWYNRRKVAEGDRPAYGTWMGSGTVVMGGCLALAGVLDLTLGRWEHAELVMAAVILAGIAVGLGLILYAQIRYNRGIF